MYLTPTNKHWIIDIEADGLTPSRVWVLCYSNAVTSERGTLIGHDAIKAWMDAHASDIFVGHNILQYDAPALNRLVGCRLVVNRLVDTLVLSTLYNPNLAGGHALDAWGKRLGHEKTVFNEWDFLSQAMIDYCENDVALTRIVYLKLAEVLKKINFSEKSCELQHKCTAIVRKQRLNGFAFNQRGAIELLVKINSEREDLTEKIHEKFPPQLVLENTFKKAFKKDGSFSANYERHLEKYPKLRFLDKEGTYEAFAWQEFNVGSPKQRVERLLELGWKPEEFTAKTDKGGGGNPRPTIKGELSPSLARFVDESGIEEVKLIAQWMALNGRATMIGTWLDEFNEETGCIHGQLWAASTLRWRHDHPNTANIPAVRRDRAANVLYGRDGYYTYEARGLWIPRAKNRVLVGTDAASLEYRMLAHYVNNEKLTDVVLNSDVHQFTGDMAGVDRAGGKTLNFAIIYGAGDAKAGSIVKGGPKEGKALKEKLFGNIPGFSGAVEQAKREFKQGRISLVDGSQIICPLEHASFNYKLQGGGARVMFQASVFLDGHIRRKGLDSLKVGDIHDEWQYDVDRKDSEEHARLAIQSIREAGEELNLNIPMDGASKIGETWAETH